VAQLLNRAQAAAIIRSTRPGGGYKLQSVEVFGPVIFFLTRATSVSISFYGVRYGYLLMGT
jgi:hypothetical protein